MRGPLAKLACLMAAVLLGAADEVDGEGDQAAADVQAAPEALADDPLWITGSSTVAPFALVAAGLSRDGQRTFVEATGTSAGLAALCGAEAAPLVGASRQVRRAELASCEARNVATVIEVELGLGAIVLAQSSEAAPLALTQADLYLAVARDVPDRPEAEDCRLVPNRARAWSDVRAGLPERRLRVYGPPVTSGTRDVLLSRGLAVGARALPCLAALERRDPEAFERALRVRRDGAWVDAGESDGALAFALTRLPDAVGVMGRVHALAQDGLAVLPLGGVYPTPETIADGRYPLSRPLYLYTEAGWLTRDPRVREVVTAFAKPEATGPSGVLTGMGLAPNPQGSQARLISTADGAATPLSLGR